MTPTTIAMASPVVRLLPGIVADFGPACGSAFAHRDRLSAKHTTVFRITRHRYFVIRAPSGDFGVPVASTYTWKPTYATFSGNDFDENRSQHPANRAKPPLAKSITSKRQKFCFHVTTLPPRTSTLLFQTARLRQDFQGSRCGLALPVSLHRMFPEGCASGSWTGSEAHLSGSSITEQHGRPRCGDKQSNSPRTLPSSPHQSPRRTDSIPQCACRRPAAPRCPSGSANSSHTIPATQPPPATFREMPRL